MKEKIKEILRRRTDNFRAKYTTEMVMEAMEEYASTLRPAPIGDEEILKKQEELNGDLDFVLTHGSIKFYLGAKWALTGKETDGWISVENKLPPIEIGSLATSDYVLIYCDERQYVAFYDQGKWYAVNEEEVYINVTHWQPLPTAPKSQTT